MSAGPPCCASQRLGGTRWRRRGSFQECRRGAGGADRKNAFASAAHFAAGSGWSGSRGSWSSTRLPPRSSTWSACCSSKWRLAVVGCAAAQRAAGLAERRELATVEHAHQLLANTARHGGWLAALDTWEQHCSLQQSQLHCSLGEQSSSSSPATLDAALKFFKQSPKSFCPPHHSSYFW